MANEDLNFLPEILGAYIESLEKAAKGGSKEDKQKLKEVQDTYKNLKKTQAKLDAYARKLAKLNFSKEASKLKSGMSKLRKKLNQFLDKIRDKRIANLSSKIEALGTILAEAKQKSDKFLEEAERVANKEAQPYELGLTELTPPNNPPPNNPQREKAKKMILEAFNPPPTRATKFTVQDVMREVLDPKKTDKEREESLRYYLSLPGAAEAMQAFLTAQLGTAQRQGGQKLLGDADKDKPIQSMKFDPKQLDILMRTFSAVWQDPGIASKAVAEISNRNPQVGRMLIEARPAAGPTPKAPAMIELPSSQELEERKEPQPPSQEQQDYKIVQLAKAVGGAIKYMTGWGSPHETNAEEPKKPSPTPSHDKGKEQKRGWGSWLGW